MQSNVFTAFHYRSSCYKPTYCEHCWQKCRIFIVYMCTQEQNALFEFTNLNGRKQSRTEVSKIPNASIRDLGPVYMDVGDPQIGEVTCSRSPHLSCKRDQIKMRDYVDRRVTPPKRVTSPTWGPTPPCKQALRL